MFEARFGREQRYSRVRCEALLPAEYDRICGRWVAVINARHTMGWAVIRRGERQLRRLAPLCALHPGSDGFRVVRRVSTWLHGLQPDSRLNAQMDAEYTANRLNAAGFTATVVTLRDSYRLNAFGHGHYDSEFVVVANCADWQVHAALRRPMPSSDFVAWCRIRGVNPLACHAFLRRKDDNP